MSGKIPEFIEYLKPLSFALSVADESELPEIEEEMRRAGLLKAAKNNVKNKSKEIKSTPRLYEIEGFSVYVGKNNTQNEQVTFRIAKAKTYGCTRRRYTPGHVAVIAENRDVPPSVLLKAAEITAFSLRRETEQKSPLTTPRAKT